MGNGESVSYGKLVLVPAVITLAVTLLRLVGELLSWSPTLFSRAAGGGFALVGISWLVPVFGVYFAWKLAGAAHRPDSVLRALGLTILAIAIVPLTGFTAARLGVDQRSPTTLLLFAVASVVALLVGLTAWPALGRTLFAYALAARIPVMVVMLVAILANWGTHYDVAPPGVAEMAPLTKWFMIGVLPQATIWLWFTVVLGSLFGIVTVALFRRRPA